MVPMSDGIVQRLTAAKDRLKEKGYECPSVEVGMKILGDYTPVFWASVKLGSPKEWVGPLAYPLSGLSDALDYIDRVVAAIPTAKSQEMLHHTAMAKLSPEELSALKASL